MRTDDIIAIHWFSFLWSGGMAWEFAMERASGLEEDITIPAGHLRQPRSWSDAYKKTYPLEKLARLLRSWRKHFLRQSTYSSKRGTRAWLSRRICSKNHRRLIDIDATEEADKLGRSIRETPREDEWRQGALNHGRVWSNT